MVMASLAWNLKAWFGLLLPEKGRWASKYKTEKQAVIRMEFKSFVNAFIRVPAQIIRQGRKTIYRLLAWNPLATGFPSRLRPDRDNHAMLKQRPAFRDRHAPYRELSPDAMYEPYDAPKTVQNALTHEAIRGKTLSRSMNASKFANRSCRLGIRLFKELVQTPRQSVSQLCYCPIVGSMATYCGGPSSASPSQPP